MKRISVDKVVINVGVGKSGEPMEKAKNALLELTGHKPDVRGAKETIRDFGIHKGEPIGVIVTLRREPAVEFLKRVVMQLRGMCSRRRHLTTTATFLLAFMNILTSQGTKYNPDIGIFGMDINVVLSRPGYRIARKSRKRSKIGKTHRINRDEAIEFFKQEYGAEVE